MTTVVEARQLFQNNQLDQARSICEMVLSIDSGNAEALHLLGLTHIKQDRYEQGLELILRALQRQPTAEMHCNAGAALRSMGRFEEARSQFYSSLDFDGKFSRALSYLAQTKQYSGGDLEGQALLSKIDQLLEEEPLPLEDQNHLHFAAAKIHEDCKRYSQAFYHYQMGNAARGFTFDPSQEAQFVARTIRAFPASCFEGPEAEKRAAISHPSRRPIFIVGMPRSGSTLIEQILSSHPQVHGAGELPDIPSIVGTLPRYADGSAEFPECVWNLKVRLGDIATAYLNRLNTINSTARRVIDKNLSNYRYLGLLALMLPNARIIHACRDPLDTCLSCFFQNFVNNHEYAFHLAHLGFKYRQYQKLMRHWRSTLPNPIHDVFYEQLIANPERVSRKLVAFCGLPWDDACLQPNATERPVATASSWQVRQPIYRTSLQRWRRYADFIGPLRVALQEQPQHPSSTTSPAR